MKEPVTDYYRNILLKLWLSFLHSAITSSQGAFQQINQMANGCGGYCP